MEALVPTYLLSELPPLGWWEELDSSTGRNQSPSALETYGFPRPATDIHAIQTQMRYRLGSAQGWLIPKGAPLKN